MADEELPDPFAMTVRHDPGGDSLNFTIPNGWAQDEIRWECEMSPDLRTWTPIATVGIGAYLLNGPALHGTVYFPASVASSAFYRLKAVPVSDPF